MNPLKIKLKEENPDTFTGTIGNHYVHINRTKWDTWEGTAWPETGEATIYLRGDTMHEVRNALHNRLLARI